MSSRARRVEGVVRGGSGVGVTDDIDHVVRRDRRRPDAYPRDQPESVFASILAILVKKVPGARAVALVDFDGEAVDYAGRADAFTLKVSAAHWKIILDEARAQIDLASTSWIAATTAGASFVVRALPEGYALVVLLARYAGVISPLRRAFDECAAALALEAGWARPAGPWVGVDVVSYGRRPQAIRRGEAHDGVEVIGRLSNRLAKGERGWRIRTESGIEATLVREPGGHWYTDEPMLIVRDAKKSL